MQVQVELQQNVTSHLADSNLQPSCCETTVPATTPLCFLDVYHFYLSTVSRYAIKIFYNTTILHTQVPGKSSTNIYVQAVLNGLCNL